MNDYIETMTLRDQANEALYLETLTIKISNEENTPQTESLKSDKVEIKIDDLDHKFHLIYHTEKRKKEVSIYHPYFLYDVDGLILPG